MYGRKGIRPVKNLSGGMLVWLSVWDEVQIIVLESFCKLNQKHAMCWLSPYWSDTRYFSNCCEMLHQTQQLSCSTYTVDIASSDYSAFSETIRLIDF